MLLLLACLKRYFLKIYAQSILLLYCCKKCNTCCVAILYSVGLLPLWKNVSNSTSNPKFALFEKFFSRLERKEFWLSRNIQIYKIAKKFQSMLVRNASFDAIDLGLIWPCYSSRSMYVMHISSSIILFQVKKFEIRQIIA